MPAQRPQVAQVPAASPLTRAEASATELRPTLYAVAALVGLLIVDVVVISVFGDARANNVFLGIFFFAVLYGSVGSLIGAVTLRAAAKWAENLDFTYGAAYLTVFLAYLINTAIALPIGLLLASEGIGRYGDLTMRYSLLPADLAVAAVLVSTRHRLSFAKGAKIVGVMLLIALAIGAVLGGFMGLMFWVTSR